MGLGSRAPDLEGLSSFIRRRRNDLGLTQMQLAERLIWEQKRVSNLEHGKYGLPSLPLLARLAEGLEVSLSDVLRALGYDNTESPSMKQAQQESAHCAALLYCLESLLSMRETDPDAVFQQACRVIADAMGAGLAAVYMQEGERLRLVGTNDSNYASQLQGLQFDHLVLGRDATHVQTAGGGAVGHAGEPGHEGPLVRVLREVLDVRSWLATSIQAGGHASGMVVVASTASGHFSQDDRTFFDAVAHWMGLVAQRAVLLKSSR